MHEACEEYGVMLSLVMPNLYNHAENELQYGDMMRINEDVFNGAGTISATGSAGSTRSTGLNGQIPSTALRRGLT